MLVYFDRKGFIKKYYEPEPDSIELAEGSTLKDFCIKVNETAEGEAKHALWNSKAKRYRGPVMISIDGKSVKDLSYRLKDGQRITLAYYVIGG